MWLADLDAKKGLDVDATLAQWGVPAHERTSTRDARGAHVYVLSEREGAVVKDTDVIPGVDVNGYRADGSGKALSWIVGPGYENLISPADMLVPERELPEAFVGRVYAPQANERRRKADSDRGDRCDRARGCIPRELVDAAYSTERFDVDRLLREHGAASRNQVVWAGMAHAVANGSAITDEAIEEIAQAANAVCPKDHTYEISEAAASRRQAESYAVTENVPSYIRAKRCARGCSPLARRALDVAIVFAHRHGTTEGLWNLEKEIVTQLGCSRASAYRATAELEKCDALLIEEEHVFRRKAGREGNRTRTWTVGPELTVRQAIDRDRLRRRRSRPRRLPFSRGARAHIPHTRVREHESTFTVLKRENKRMPRVSTETRCPPPAPHDPTIAPPANRVRAGPYPLAGLVEPEPDMTSMIDPARPRVPDASFDADAVLAETNRRFERMAEADRSRYVSDRCR